MGDVQHVGVERSLPTGTVTFLLTDVAGSTRQWEDDPAAMAVAVARHYELLDEAISRHEGVRPVEQGEGDSVVAAFSLASDAVACALDLHRAFAAESFSRGCRVEVRVALHTGEAALRDVSNYFGLALNRVARLRAIAHGGQVLVSGTTADVVADRVPEGVVLRDLGTHRLRDLSRPERVFQLDDADAPRRFPALRSLDVLPNNLPVQLTSFVGREAEQAEVRALLAEHRLVTLTGAGGCGKTRMALQVAAAMTASYDAGVWLVELAPLADPDVVPVAVLRALGAREAPGRAPTDHLVDVLSHSKVLLVMDNCEHLINPAATLIDTVVQRCPGVSVLATSREHLGVPGERAWRVPPMTTPQQPADGTESLATYDAVRLFVERATQARPNFAVTNPTAPAVAEICARLDGIPLAIELAAARCRVLSVEEIAAGLSDRFRLLAGDRRRVLARQQTLRASVDWSYDLLGSAEQIVLARLSVFAGPFTLDAAEAVAAGDGIEPNAVLELLTSLVDRSLVTVGDDQGPGTRYRLLETIRAYGRERLVDAGEDTPARDRHLAYFADVARSAVPALDRADPAWLDRLDRERDDLRAAVAWASSHPEHAAGALELVADLTFFWQLRGLYEEGKAAFRRALAAADPAASHPRARALWGLAHLCNFGDDHATASTAGAEALTMAEALDDAGLRGRALNVTGFLELWLDPAASRPRLLGAVAAARQAGDDWCLCDSLEVVAATHTFQDGDAALAALDEGAPIAERLGNSFLLAWDAWLRAAVAWQQGDIAAAEELSTRALDRSLAVGDPTTFAYAHAQLGRVLVASGRHDQAREQLGEALSWLRDRPGLFAPELVGQSLGYAELMAGDVDTAVARLDAVADRIQHLGDATTAGWVPERGEALLAVGETARARTSLDAAIASARRTGQLPNLAHLTLLKAYVERADGDPGQAEDLAHDALAALTERASQLRLADVLDLLAGLAADADSGVEAARLFGAADSVRATQGSVVLPIHQPTRDSDLVRIRAIVGHDAFDAAHAEGTALTTNDAVAYARRARGERKRPSLGWASLTPTELEVVKLAARGLTNPEIGQRLFIGRGTVKTHLAHVYTKLGVANRTELATNVARQALDGR